MRVHMWAALVISLFALGFSVAALSIALICLQRG